MKTPSIKLIIILAIIVILGCGALGVGVVVAYQWFVASPVTQSAPNQRATATPLPKPVAFRTADTATPSPTAIKPTPTPRPTSTPKPTATPTQPPSPTSPKGDGFYLVGDEIAPGKWRSTGKGDRCYWARLDDKQEWLDNYFGMSGGVLTIQPTDFMVQLEDCGIWQYMDDQTTTAKPEPPQNHPAPRTDVVVCNTVLNSEYQGVYVQWMGSILDEYPGQEFQVWWENPVTGTDCDYEAFFVTYSGGEKLYANDIVLVTGEIIDTAYEYPNTYGSRQYGVVVRADEVVVLNKPTP